MNNKNYFQKLNVSFITCLPHHEFGQLIHNIIAIPENDDFEDAQLIDAYDVISKKSDVLDDVRVRNRKHELSSVLVDAAAIRREHLLSLMKSIQAGLLSVNPDYRLAASVLFQWVRPERRHFNYPGIESHSRLVNNLTAALANSEDIGNALNTLNLVNHFQFILDETKEIQRNFIKRNNDLAANKMKVKGLRDEIYVSLKVFLTHVEGYVNIDKSGEHICHKWFREIKELLDYYQRRLKSRSTLRMKSAEDSGSEGDVSFTGPDNDIDTPTGGDVDNNLDESND